MSVPVNGISFTEVGLFETHGVPETLSCVVVIDGMI
jgi:hypothetical protein